MNDIEPITQTKLYGLTKFFNELIRLEKKDNLPGAILLSGQKGLGKSTLAYHYINYILSKNEEFQYNLKEFEINQNNHSFITTLNKSNPNLITLNISLEKKFIDINQVRELIANLNKYSFNLKPRFVLIDNIELLNINSINALLKVIEEPSSNNHFILINNNKKILKTLLSRCINFNISLSHKENLDVANQLLKGKLYELINKDLINYYLTPGKIYNLVKFGLINNYDLTKFTLKEFIKIILKNNYYKKDDLIKPLFFDFIEFYLSKTNLSISLKIENKYNYFLKRISDIKKFNLDEESFFLEFEEEVLNG